MAKLRFKDIASRITGISIKVFGVSSGTLRNPREKLCERPLSSMKTDVRSTMTSYEIEHEVAESVLSIRKELTDALKRLPDDSQAAPPMRAMRAACREYLGRGRRRHGGHFGFTTELGRFRAMIGVQVAYLAVKFGIDVDGELLRVIPPELRDVKYLEP